MRLLNCYFNWKRQCLPAAALLAGLILAAVLAQPARAQEGSACFGCHQERYWQFDSGRAACFSTMPGRCTDCHAGDANILEVDQAHAGVIASPARDGAAACKSCHLEDALDRAQSLGAYTGTVRQPGAATLPLQPVTPSPSPVDSGRQAAGALFLGLGSGGMLIFGWRCWKQDCAARQK